MATRWDNFTDDEIYLLQRLAIEAAPSITLGADYSREEQKICERLTNELIKENVNRSFTAEDLCDIITVVEKV